MTDTPLRIGDLSRETGMKVVTIRYYETTGLLPKPARSDSGQRLYDADAVARLRFVRRARDLGFPLPRIRELIDLSQHRWTPCAGVDRIAEAHLAEVEGKIADLQALARELATILASCRGTGDVSDCRVIEALASR